MPQNELLEKINAETTVQISTLAPLDMHPDALQRTFRDSKPGEAARGPTLGEVLIDGGNGRGAAGYRAGRRALGTLFSGLVQIEEAHKSLLTQIQVGVQKATGKPILQMGVPAERQAELATAM